MWASNDDGYLIFVPLPDRGVCRNCGKMYFRRIEDRREWQTDVPDVCPYCQHENGRITGVAFRNQPISVNY